VRKQTENGCRTIALKTRLSPAMVARPAESRSVMVKMISHANATIIHSLND